MGSSAQTVASILNAAQIQIFNFLFQFLAAVLTNRENHRTDTQYEDAMIAKLFLFQFVNSYASFFYIGFIAKYQPAQPDAQDNWQGDCGAKNCMRPLAWNLGIIFRKICGVLFFNVTSICRNITHLSFVFRIYLSVTYDDWQCDGNWNPLCSQLLPFSHRHHLCQRGEEQ